MKKDLLTVKELAAELRMSLKSIQRAYRREEIPVQWLGRMARFDLTQVRRAMARNGRSRMRRLNGTSNQQGATAAKGRRRAQQKRPRSVKRGRASQVSRANGKAVMCRLWPSITPVY
jgi:hypothetical protein